MNLDSKINALGGIENAQNHLLELKLYLLLKRHLLKSESIKSDYFFFKNLYLRLFDIYFETESSRLCIPQYSYIICKQSLYFDTLHKENEAAKKYKSFYPSGRAILIYSEKGSVQDESIKAIINEGYLEIYNFDEFYKLVKINADFVDFQGTEIDKQKKVISKAKEAFNDNNITLFLGAGVSQDAGGPSWNELLKKVFTHFNRKYDFSKKDFGLLSKALNSSSIVQGRFALPEDVRTDEFANYLREKVLYKKIDLKSSKLISAICDIVDTGNVESIISYNYDDLVETAIKDRNIKQVESVYEKIRTKRGTLPVYHVHGFVPRIYDGIEANPVLSEKDYHKEYSDAYYWANIEQLHALDRNTCFFIGLSMSDPNLRRLLDISKIGQDEPRHFLFLRKGEFYKDEKKNYRKNKALKDQIEFQLVDLGINTIWYEKHEDIPDIISEIINIQTQGI